mgnify:CR=1 FL=1
MILAINSTMIFASLGVFLLVILLLTVILLVAKKYLVPSGDEIGRASCRERV